MAASDCQAAIVLIDNSFSSINGDFIPTRIEAQKNTVEVFSRYFLRGNKESVFGFGTLSDFDFGINTSLSQDLRKIRMNLDTVRCGGKVQLEKAIRCGLFALKHRPKEVPNRKLIILLASQHELTNEKAETLAAIANRDGACIDIICFGNDEINKDTLKLFVEKLGNKSYFSEIPIGTAVLSDAVMNAYMSNFNAQMPPASADDFNFNDDEMQRVLAMSRQEAGIADENEIVDPDLLAAIEESRRMLEDGNDQPNAANAPAVDEIGLDDPELLEAIRASLETHDDDGATNNNNNEEVDPDFEEALRLSNEINVDDDDDEPQNEKGKEEKKDESKEEKKKESEIDKKLEEDINSLIDSPDALQSILSEFGDIGDTKKDEEPKKQ